ncbi:MAG: ATP-dependent DNA helicase RecG [Oscillospiraceae bacterium]|nr:ATP-dependent DNA helicase RecG [Oscillospiraceae bacterium]
MELNTPLTEFPGVGPARSKKLGKLGLFQAGDLLTYYPRAYEDRRRVCSITAAPEDAEVCVEVLVAETPRVSYIRKGLELTKVKVADAAAVMTVTFFNQSYLRTSLKVGKEYVFFGRVERVGGQYRMTNPVVEKADRRSVTGCILPVYPLTAGVSNAMLVGFTRKAVEACAPLVEDVLPESLRVAHQLMPRAEALRDVHFPEDFEALEDAARRLSFEETFCFALGLALLRRRRDGGVAPVLGGGSETEFLNLLPFPPTAAQRRAMAELAADVKSGRPMNRLLQGDVGSGKTAVAAYAAFLACKSGAQAAMMAPTEILAEQHFRSLTALLAPAGVEVALLTASRSAVEKRAVKEGLRSGAISFVVGTHALLSEGVEFANLAMVVTDEQHRFGVTQRAALAEKANREEETPHILVMSATPIPRTLALILYGDLDVSVLDELPPGRTPIETYLIGEDKRQRMYNFVRKLTGEGRQAYIVCPAVEENEEAEGTQDLKAVTVYAGELQKKVFPDLRVAFLHGKMKGKDKDAVMSAFAAGEIDVLVATTVVEVGVDVPNAALMVIENAERFGLSQLHQLRGRVGRGEHQSYCILMSATRSEESRARLKALRDTSDGFKIAEEDLKLRGPGDFFGARQHGLPAMKLVGQSLDMRLLKEAQTAAEELLRGDPELTKAEHAPLRRRVEALFRDQSERLN